MNTVKYIIFEDAARDGRKVPILWPADYANHDDMSDAFRHAVRDRELATNRNEQEGPWKNPKPVSAGFARVNGEGHGVSVFGESETLDMKPAEGDAGIIQSFLMERTS